MPSPFLQPTGFGQIINQAPGSGTLFGGKHPRIVDIKGIDYEIAFLENFHATSASEMQAAGMILT